MIGILKNPSFSVSFIWVVILNLAVNLQKNILHEILGLPVVVQDSERHAEYQPVMPIEEHSQGIGLAGPQLLHQLFVCAGLQAVGCHRNSLREGQNQAIRGQQKLGVQTTTKYAACRALLYQRNRE